MSSPLQAARGLLTSRYECKYFVSEAQAEHVRRVIRPLVRPDAYAARQPDHRYPISSLYLDTGDLALYRQSAQGVKNRFKLRMRTYADDAASPVYLEIKKRADAVVMKRRAPVAGGRVRAWLGGAPGARLTDNGSTDAAVAEFVSLTRRIAARPVLRVRYVREAFESTGPDPVRITLDTEVEYAISSEGELGLNGTGWAPTPTDGVILEIKFTERFPSWIAALIESLQLQKQSIPKYALSIADAVARRYPQ